MCSLETPLVHFHVHLVYLRLHLCHPMGHLCFKNTKCLCWYHDSNAILWTFCLLNFVIFFCFDCFSNCLLVFGNIKLIDSLLRLWFLKLSSHVIMANSFLGQVSGPWSGKHSSEPYSLHPGLCFQHPVLKLTGSFISSRLFLS